MSTTTDLAERLSGLLDELAQSTPVGDDNVEFIPRDVLSADSTSSDPRRKFVAVAAVAVLVVGAGALAWSTATRDGSSGDPRPAAATQPPAPADRTSPPQIDASTAIPTRADPTLYPVLDDPPPGLEITALTQDVPAEPLWTEGLLGRRSGATVADTVAITSRAEPFDIAPMADRPPTTSDVFGQPATVYDYALPDGRPLFHVTWGSGPYFLASGSDPLTFLHGAPEDFATATIGADGVPELTFGTLPAGYEVMAAPAVVGAARSGATLSVGADNYDISVGTRNWLVGMADVAPLRKVDVAGRIGWMFDTSDPAVTQDVTWQLDDSTYAYLKVNDGTDAEGALDLARRITFVDYDTWNRRYLPDEQGTTGSIAPDSSATTTTVAVALNGDLEQGERPVIDCSSNGCETHTVKAGDAPIHLAEKFCVTLSEILAANRWANFGEFPAPGVTIHMPPEHVGTPCPDPAG